jgi:hypothetical protein
VYETTWKIIGERRSKTLKELGRRVINTKDEEEACRASAGIKFRCPMIEYFRSHFPKYDRHSFCISLSFGYLQAKTHP